jgi:transposase
MVEHINDEFSGLSTLLHKAGLAVAEVAPIFGVSRTSVYTWINEGKGPQQGVIRRQGGAAIKLIERAVAAGDLPMKNVELNDRGAVLASIFRKHLGPPRAQVPRSED